MSYSATEYSSVFFFFIILMQFDFKFIKVVQFFFLNFHEGQSRENLL